MRNLILPFILLLTFMFSCSENNIDEEILQKNTSYDVYVAGSENNKASYWKNNIKTELINGDNLSPVEIKVQNNDIYVTATNNINAISFKSIHYFWKNNVKYDLKQYLNIPNNAQYNITGFTVNNGDVYFAGHVENPAATSTLDRFELCYWKNGIKTMLYKSQNISSAESIFVDGIDVYVSTVKVDNNQNVERGYFKNSIFTSVNANFVYNFAKNTNGVHLLLLKNLKYYSKNLYTATESVIGDYTHPVPVFGKICSDYYTTDLFTTYNYAGNLYFKNSTSILPNFSSLPYIQDMFVLNNKIYMIKYKNEISSYNGKVFIDGIESQNITSTPNGNNYFSGTFNSIFVVEN